MLGTKILGRRGESIAKEYLLKNNYKIIAANYKSGYQEIDLITLYKKDYVFIEVKTRLKNKESLVENPLAARQVKNLKKAILKYVAQNKLSLDRVQLDLIFILVNDNKNCADLKHYRDIF